MDKYLCLVLVGVVTYNPSILLYCLCNLSFLLPVGIKGIGHLFTKHKRLAVFWGYFEWSVQKKLAMCLCAWSHILVVLVNFVILIVCLLLLLQNHKGPLVKLSELSAGGSHITDSSLLNNVNKLRECWLKCQNTAVFDDQVSSFYRECSSRWVMRYC